VIDSDLSAKQPAYGWRHIAGLAWQHRRSLIVAHLVAILATLSSVPVPLLMPLLVDEVLLDQPGAIVHAIDAWFPATWHGPLLYIGLVLLATLLLRLASLLLGVWQMWRFTTVSKDVVFRLRADLVGRLRRVSMAEYETLGSGQVISHLVTDLDTLDNFIGQGLGKFLIAVLSLAGMAAVLLWLHWQLALLILLLNPLVIWLTLLLGRKVKELKKQENQAYAGFQEVLRETLEAIWQLRACNREPHYLGKVVASAKEIKQRAIDYAWKTDAASRFSFAVFVFGFDLFRALSMFMVLFSDLSIGEMFAVFGYLWFMMGPMQDILGIQYAYHSASAALGRLNRLFDLREEPVYPRLRNPFAGQLTVSVRLERVSFAYTPQEPVLNEISLEIEAGEKVAVVGASGGGKTTLVQILLGLYPPAAGQVYFGNVPISEIGLDLVREHVATVLQHPALFNDSLRVNLSLGRDLPDAELWRALELAQLRRVAESLPNGLDTRLGSRGVRLSGGERQRVAMARMLLAEPKVVILDEATSALDSDTEHRLHRTLAEHLAGKTTLIIAHRLSAVRQADRVLVFDGGRIVEQGAHDSLIRGSGLYARLYGRQSGF
jgi:ATP-binding cassette subfamily C protein